MGEYGRGCKGIGRGWGGRGGGVLVLEATGLLMQESDLGRTTQSDDQNGFNELLRMVMQWTVRYQCPVGAQFEFNCYKHYAQLLLHHTGNPTTTLLSLEGVTQGDPLSMVLYGITLVPLV